MNKLKVLATIVISIICLAFIVFALTSNSNITNTGTISSVGVLVTPNSINWGNVDSGSINKYPVTISNIGNKPENLTMYTIGLPSYLVLDWNCSGVNLDVGKTVTSLFTLTVNYSAVGGTQFNFNITVVGTG